ncbi:cyclodeaminase/cyclohydrolase family protein [Hathewaya histolytica]|uniref:cyclodeaminase/cyclohydrolase family protein n=1 Tax=Hathewaya histolytica TaxID=1498 RepID=UPI003B670179
MLENKTVRGYVDQLSSSEPIPGGGSVAGLCAALGSALNSMVFSLTVGKKAYNELSMEEKKIIDEHYDKSLKLKDEFMDLMNKDAQIFSRFIEIFKLPKETEEQKKIRANKLEEGYKEALQIPLETLEKSEVLYDYILTAAKYGSKGVISDAGAAVIMLHAALETSIINIKINLNGINNKDFKREILQKCTKIEQSTLSKKAEIIKTVEERM